MSHLRYVESKKKRRKTKKEHVTECAIFPDGDETDCSSRATFYDIRTYSSTSTSVSQRSSIDETYDQITENSESHFHEEKHDGLIYKLNSFSPFERVNSGCKITTKTTTTTHVSAVGITITSPEPPKSPLYMRPSCSTRIRSESTDTDSSFDEFETHTHNGSKSRKIDNKEKPLKSNITEQNVMMLPSIDVIPPSPTLSVFSQRQVIKKKQVDSHSRITLSPITCRTLTPMSSLSSNSTITDTFSITSGSDDGMFSMRPRFFSKRNVLPPISRSVSQDQNDDDVFLSTPMKSGKRNKIAMKCRKTKTRSLDEYHINSCGIDCTINAQKIPEVQKYNENSLHNFEHEPSKKNNLYRQMHIPSTKFVDYHFKESDLNKNERVSQSLKSQKQGYHTGEDSNIKEKKLNTRKKSSVHCSPSKGLSTVKDHNKSKAKNMLVDTRNQKQKRIRKKSTGKNRYMDGKLRREASVCKSISGSDSIDYMPQYIKDEPKYIPNSITNLRKGVKSISDSSDCMSLRSEQTQSSYL